MTSATRPALSLSEKPDDPLKGTEVILASYQPSHPTNSGGSRLKAQVISILVGADLPVVLAQGEKADPAAYPAALRSRLCKPRWMNALSSVRYVNYLYFNAWLAKEIFARSRSHKVVVVQFDWATIPPAMLMKSLKLCQWISVLGDSLNAHDGSELGWSTRRMGLPLPLAKVVEGLAKHARFAVVVNKDEAQSLKARGFSHEKVVCIPLTVPVLPRPRMLRSNEFRERFLSERGLAPTTKLVSFHGDLNYPPNRSAADLIVSVIAPRTLELNPSIVFLISGAGEAPPRPGPNVVVLGFVDDLEQLLSNVDVEIVPLEHGAGLKNKVLDALNCAVPVVTTSVGRFGFESAGCPLIVAEIDDFPKAIVDLVNDDHRAQIGESGWRYVKANYSVALLDEYVKMVRTVKEEMSS